MTTERKAGWTLVALLICAHGLRLPRSQAADWPTYRGNCQRSGVSSETLKLPLRESWVHRATHAPRPAWPPPARQDFAHRLYGLSPTMIYDRAYHVAVVGEALYYASSADDAVYCVDATTGDTRWSFVTEGPVRLAPTIDDGKAYVGSDDGCVYCLDAADGSLRWKYRAGPEDRRQPGNGRMISLWPVRSGVVVDGGVAYFAAGLFPTQGVYLCGVNAEDGREVWRQRIDVSAQAYLWASPTRLFIPTGRTAPRAFDRSNGEPLGDLGRLGGSFALVLEDMIVHGGDEKGQIHIDEPATQERIVSIAALRLLAKGPMVYFLKQDTLSALDRVQYLQLSRQITAMERVKKNERTEAQRKQLVELKRQRKACQKWEVPCRAPYELIAAGDTIFAGGEDQVVAYSAASGEVVWTGAVTGKAYGLAVSRGRLFVSTDRGTIHCFGPTLAEGRSAVVREPGREASSSPYPEDEWTPVYARAADAIVKKSGVKQGYCLVLDAAAGRLACELAQRTDLRIVGAETDAEKVALARRVLSEAGLYGTRITIHHVRSDHLPYPNYFANLIVSDETVITGRPPSASAAELWRVLRPCGGMAVIGAESADGLDEWGSGRLPGWEVSSDGRACWGTVRRGPLPGSGEWTHTYAEPGNSASSGDQLVFGEMDVQWFGRPGPRQMIDRHHRNVPPLYKDGRCFIPGDCIVFAVDAYNGTILWQVETPDSRRLGVFLDVGNMAVDEECLYLAAGDKCYGLDVETGARRCAYPLPQPVENEPHAWGYVAYCEDLLFGSGCKPGAAFTETGPEAEKGLWGQEMKLVTSDYLFAMGRESGETRWSYQSGRVINGTITLGDGHMYFVESHSPAALADKSGRVPLKTLFGAGEQYLVALNMRTGDVEYKQEIDVEQMQEVCYLGYADGILLFSGSKRTGKTVHYHYHAFDASTGETRWLADHDSGLPSDGGHGEYNRHPTIVGDTIYTWPYAYKLKTGERIEGWKFARLGHGCGGISASDTSLFWRGWNPWMYDLSPGAGPLRLTEVTRPGCWINIIPAGGLVLIPEASSGCTCPFSLQTSMALCPGLPAPQTRTRVPQFLDSLKLEIFDPLETGQIRYTLDGREPAKTSRLYATPITLSETTRLRARTFRDDGNRSRLLDQTYTKVAARPAERTVGLKAELRYQSYEGSHVSRIAELDGWRLVAEGTADEVSLKPARRADDFSLKFSGYIRVPRDGIYTFYTNSDDGSRLSIGADTVVDNDGLHTAQEKQGTVPLAAGVHPITVVFFQAGGNALLEVSWEGAGVPKQRIPAAVLFHRP